MFRRIGLNLVSTRFDISAPHLALTALPAHTIARRLTVSWTASDAISGARQSWLELQIDGGAWQPFGTIPPAADRWDYLFFI